MLKGGDDEYIDIRLVDWSSQTFVRVGLIQDSYRVREAREKKRVELETNGNGKEQLQSLPSEDSSILLRDQDYNFGFDRYCDFERHYDRPHRRNWSFKYPDGELINWDGAGSIGRVKII